MNLIEDPSIQRQCARLNIRFREPNISISQIISNVRTRLCDHQNNTARLCEPQSGDYVEWKSLHDDLTDLQERLEKISQKSQPAALPPLNPDSDSPSALDQLHQKIPLDDPFVANLRQTDPKFAANYELLQKCAEKIHIHSQTAQSEIPKSESPKSPISNIKPEIPNPQSPPLTDSQKEKLPRLHETESPLDALSPERRAKLFDLLNECKYSEVLAVVTLPEPEGWGLSTSFSSLRRFYGRYNKTRFDRERQAIEAETDQLLDDPNVTDAQLSAASERFLKIRLLETCKNKTTAARELRDLFQIQIRQKQLALAELRLQYLMQKNQPGEPQRA